MLNLQQKFASFLAIVFIVTLVRIAPADDSIDDPSLKDIKSKEGYIVDLRQLIERSKKKIQKVDDKLQDQAKQRRNQLREEKAREYFEQGQRLYDEGKYKKAQDMWEKAIKITDHPEMKGYVNNSVQKTKRQNNFFRKEENERLSRLELERGYSVKEVESAYHAGVALFKKKDYLGAKEEFSRVDEMFPDHKATRSYLMIIDQEIAKEQERLIQEKIQEERIARQKEKAAWRAALEEQELEREAQLHEQAEQAYQEAIQLYRAHEYDRAKARFKEVAWLLPKYRKTEKFLARIDLDKEEYKNLTDEKKKKQYEYQKKLEDKLERDRIRELAKQKEIDKREELRRLREEAGFLYDAAIELYKKGKIEAAHSKFMEVEAVLPDYAKTKSYLRKIEKQQQEELDKQRYAFEEEIKRERLILKREEERLRLEAEREKLEMIRIEEKNRQEEEKRKLQQKKMEERLARKKAKKQAKERAAAERLERLRAKEKAKELAKQAERKAKEEAKRKEEEAKRREMEERARLLAEKEEMERKKQEGIARAKALEEEARRKQAALEKEVEATYKHAVRMFEKNNLAQAKNQFIIVSQLKADYKSTDDYLKKIDELLFGDHSQKSKPLIQTKVKKKQIIKKDSDVELKTKKNDIVEKAVEEHLMYKQKRAAVMYREAESFYQNGQFEIAKRKFIEIEAYVPNFKDTREYLGRIDKDIREGVASVRKINLAKDDNYQSMSRQAKYKENVYGDKREMVLEDAGDGKISPKVTRHKRSDGAEMVISQHIKEAESFYTQAVELYRQKKYDDAKKVFLKTNETIPDFRKSNYYLSKIEKIQKKIKKKQEKKARKLARKNKVSKKTMAMKEENALKLYEEGLRLYKSKNLKGAREKFKETTKIIPQYRFSEQYIKRIDRKLADLSDSDQTKNQVDELVKVQDKVVPKEKAGESKEEYHKKKKKREKFVWKQSVGEDEEDYFKAAKEFKSEADKNLEQMVNKIYKQGKTFFRAEKYVYARERFLKVKELMPFYKNTEDYITRINSELGISQAWLNREQMLKAKEKRRKDGLNWETTGAKRVERLKEKDSYAEHLENKRKRSFRKMLKKDRKLYKKIKADRDKLARKSRSEIRKQLKAENAKRSKEEKRELQRKKEELEAKQKSLKKKLEDERAARILKVEEDRRKAVELAKQAEALSRAAEEEAERLDIEKKKAVRAELIREKGYDPKVMNKMHHDQIKSELDKKEMLRKRKALRKEHSRRTKKDKKILKKEQKEIKKYLKKKENKNKKKWGDTVAKSYEEAIRLYRNEDYIGAKLKFASVLAMSPGYKNAKNFMEKAHQRHLAFQMKIEAETKMAVDEEQRRRGNIKDYKKIKKAIKEKKKKVEKIKKESKKLEKESKKNKKGSRKVKKEAKKLKKEAEKINKEPKKVKKEYKKVKKEAEKLKEDAEKEKSAAKKIKRDSLKKKKEAKRIKKEAKKAKKLAKKLQKEQKKSRSFYEKVKKEEKRKTIWAKKRERELRKKAEKLRKEEQRLKALEKRLAEKDYNALSKEALDKSKQIDIAKAEFSELVEAIENKKGVKKEVKEALKAQKLMAKKEKEFKKKSMEEHSKRIKELEKIQKKEMKENARLEKMKIRHEKKKKSAEKKRLKKKMDKTYNEATRLMALERKEESDEKFAQYEKMLTNELLSEAYIIKMRSRLEKDKNRIRNYLDQEKKRKELIKEKRKKRVKEKKTKKEVARSSDMLKLEEQINKEEEKLAKERAEEDRRLAKEKQRRRKAREKERKKEEAAENKRLKEEYVQKLSAERKGSRKDNRLKLKESAALERSKHKNLQKELKIRKANLKNERKRIQKEFEESIARLYKRGLRLYKKKQYSDARSVFLELNSMSPGYKDTNKYLAKTQNPHVVKKNSRIKNRIFKSSMSEPKYDVDLEDLEDFENEDFIYAPPPPSEVNTRRSLIESELDDFEKRYR